MRVREVSSSWLGKQPQFSNVEKGSETRKAFVLLLVEPSRRHACQSQGPDAAYQIAEADAFPGETDLAFEWLDRAYTSAMLDSHA